LIFEGSCETEDWSNDAEKSALASQGINSILKYINRNKLHFKIYIKKTTYFKLQQYFTILLFY